MVYFSLYDQHWPIFLLLPFIIVLIKLWFYEYNILSPGVIWHNSVLTGYKLYYTETWEWMVFALSELELNPVESHVELNWQLNHTSAGPQISYHDDQSDTCRQGCVYVVSGVFSCVCVCVCVGWSPAGWLKLSLAPDPRSPHTPICTHTHTHLSLSTIVTGLIDVMHSLTLALTWFQL